MIVKTTEYNSKLITTFIQWYFVEMPIKLLKYIQEYISVLSYLFSFKFLLKTLFYPWKNQVYAYPTKGFDIKLIMQVLTANLFARFIGAMIRLITIFIGILSEILFVIFSVGIVVIWVLSPIVFVLLFVYSFFL